MTVTPERFPPRLILPLLPVVDKDNTPAEARAVFVVSVLLLLTESPEKVAPPEARVNGPAPLFITVALPVVLSVKLGVEVLILPILPEPEVSDIELEPVNVPAVWVMVPAPLAASVTAVPLALAPRAIEPFEPALVDSDNVPAATMVLEVVSPALLEMVTLLPVELPLPMFKAVPPVPTQVTLPVVLKVRLLVVPVRVLMLPEPEIRFKLVAVITPAV